MKIIHVFPTLIKGGGERVAVELANHASMAGHQVTIIVAFPVDSTLLQNEVDPRVQVLCVSDSTISKMGRYLAIFPWLWRNRSWLTKQDILHCHLTYGAVFGTIVGLCRCLTNTKQPVIVETYHAVGMNVPLFNRWFHAQLLASRDGIVLMAEDGYWKNFIMGHPKLHSEIIPNGIKVPCQGSISREARQAYRRELGIPDDCQFIIGTVGMLRPDRQPWRLLSVFAEVAQVLGEKVHFLIAGGGAEKELDHMRSLINAKGLEGKVHLPGLVLNPDKPRSIMDLYITLNVGSITGIAALEAACSGLPVLALQMLEQYDSTHEDWIWSSADSGEVAERAISLIRSPKDRGELAEKQQTYVRANHTAGSMADSYFLFYQVAIDASHKKIKTSINPSQKRI